MPKKPPAPRRFPASRTPRRAVLFCRASLPFPYFSAFAPRSFRHVSRRARFPICFQLRRALRPVVLLRSAVCPAVRFALLSVLPLFSFHLSLRPAFRSAPLPAPPRFPFCLASRSASLPAPPRFPLRPASRSASLPAPPRFPLRLAFRFASLPALLRFRSASLSLRLALRSASLPAPPLSPLPLRLASRSASLPAPPRSRLQIAVRKTQNIHILI